MKHTVVFLGKTKDNSLRRLIEEYSERVNHYTSLVIKVLRERKSGGEREVQQGEARQLLEAVGKGSLIVALDESGRTLSSEQFASQLMAWEGRGVKGVTYLIGGPTGLAEEVRRAADLVLSLSAMTLPHDLARLVLLEQLYRAYTIKAGEQYHK